MEWRNIRNNHDVEELMRIAECFHDWYVADFRYDPLVRTKDNDKSLARYYEDSDTLFLTLRYDSRDEDGIFPEFDFEFYGVVDMTFGNFKKPDSLWECLLEKVGQDWVLIAEDPLTDEERNSLSKVKSILFFRAKEIRWRRSKGKLWSDECLNGKGEII